MATGSAIGWSRLQGVVYMLTGETEQAGFAAEIEGRADPAVCCFLTQWGRPWSHGNGFSYWVEQTARRGLHVDGRNGTGRVRRGDRRPGRPGRLLLPDAVGASVEPWQRVQLLGGADCKAWSTC